MVSCEGEGVEIWMVLDVWFVKVVELFGIGYVDGGDVLMFDDVILIGLFVCID